MSVISALIKPVSDVLKKVIPDADTRLKLSHEVAIMAEKYAHEEAKAQIEVNKQEAAHQNLFVAGWRPAVGWTCCLGMAGNFIVIPISNFVLALSESDISIPLVDLATMMPVLMGMLGLGSMRSYEKSRGVQREK